MRIIHTFLLVLLALLPTVCLGQSKCPWFNEATASGVLGGAVTLTAKVGDHGAGFCLFSRQQGAAVHQLRVSVDIMKDIPKEFPTYLAQQCPAKRTPLRAIGNEAVMCSVEGNEEHAEKVVARVRERAFLVSVSSSLQDDSTLTQEMRREKANLVAEQIAGFLF
jgi:hypothetical protein